MTRAFFALPLPGDVELALSDRVGQLQALPFARELRWVPPENYHVTLAFLGEVNPRDMPRLEAIASSVAEAHGATALNISRLGWFPDASKPRLLAALLELTPALEKLRGELVQQLRRRGYAIEGRKFRPHITLARCPRGMLASQLGELQLALAMPVNELVLFESVLRPQGPVYSPLQWWPLQ